MEVLIKKLADFEKTNRSFEGFMDHPDISTLASKVLVVNNCIDMFDCKYMAMMGFEVVRFVNTENNEESLGIKTIRGVIKLTL
jgi:hypothetical protein